MRNQAFYQHIQLQLNQLKGQGLFKQEREITSPQDSHITLSEGAQLLNFCSNNYLGLANHPALIQSAIDSYPTYGFGLASVRFICGTQTIHQQLEQRLSTFLETEAPGMLSSPM